VIVSRKCQPRHCSGHWLSNWLTRKYYVSAETTRVRIGDNYIKNSLYSSSSFGVLLASSFLILDPDKRVSIKA
jgi:outer membrane usher protein FimD/PapC